MGGGKEVLCGIVGVFILMFLLINLVMIGIIVFGLMGV